MDHAGIHLFVFFAVIVLLPFLYPFYLTQVKKLDNAAALKNMKVFAVVFGLLVSLSLAVSIIRSSLS